MDLSSYDVCVELDVVKCAFLTPTSMLLSLRTGEVYALRLHLTAAVIAPGRGAVAGGGAPNRVVGQSMRPVGRASPCSVLAVSAAGGRRGRNSDRVDGGGGGGASTGLVFMGSRVGDSLLVKYAVASGGTQPGKRGKGGAGVGGAAGAGAGLKRELKVEPENDEWDGDGGDDGRGSAPANGAPGGDQKAAGSVAAAVEEGGLTDPVAGVGRAAAVKEEPKEAGGLAGMDVDNSIGYDGGGGGGGSGGSVAVDPPLASVGASEEAAAAAAAAAAATEAAGTPPPAPAAETGSEGVVDPPADGDGEVDSAETATATPTPTKQPNAAQEDGGKGPRSAGDEGGGGGGGGGSSSGKRGRAERSPSPSEGDNVGGTVVAVDGDGDVDVDGSMQPDKKRSRVSGSAPAGKEDDPAASTADTTADKKEGVPSAAGGEEQGFEPPDTTAAKPATLPEEDGGVVEAVDAMDTTSSSPPPPPPSAGPAPGTAVDGAETSYAEEVGSVAAGAVADGAAEKFYGEDEETTRLIREELEMIHEEEELYGARLGSSRAVRTRGGHEAPLANLGSKVGERVIEAVGFRLKVREAGVSVDRVRPFLKRLFRGDVVALRS